MMFWLGLVAWIAATFVLAGVPFGLLLCRLRGIEIREIGSGNIGATNAARALGKGGGALVMLLDALKGFLPVFLLRLVQGGDDPRVVGATMVAAVAGHVFSVFLRLRGGKGVATGFGVMLATYWPAGACGFLAYAALYGITRLSSLGSLAGVAVATATIWISAQALPIGIAASLIFLLVVLRHAENLRRLARREEGKV